MNKNILDIIRKVVADGILAPSGENCQPWKFLVRGDTLEIILIPERDQSAYNWDQLASCVANGALIENIAISARFHGYETVIKIFPQKNNPYLVATVIFQRLQKFVQEELYYSIHERITNRKKYQNFIIKDEQIKNLLECAQPKKNIEIFLTQDDRKKAILAEVGSINEQVMMSNEKLHQFFFSHVNWNEEEDRLKKIGFFIDTLELATLARITFRIFRNWKVTKFFNNFNLHKKIAEQNACVYRESSGFIIITSQKQDKETFIEIGRIMEKIWLTATKFNLSLQPLTGVIFFMQKIRAGKTTEFNVEQIELLTKSYDKIRSTFNIPLTKNIVFMFRIGKGDKPSAHSRRFNVDEVINFA